MWQTICALSLIILSALQLGGELHAITTTKHANVSVLAAANWSSVFLDRQKRYLLFEKGANFMVQTNIAKAIISLMPRGLNEIAEYTLTYDLPNEVRLWHAFERLQQSPAPTPTAPAASSHAAAPWNSWQQIYMPAFADKRHWQRPPQCHKIAAYGASMRRMPWCKAQRLRPPKRRQRVARRQTPAEDPNARLFYDLIERWAELPGFNARHCIMRSLCEAQHLLLAPGHSLLHDLLRILLEYALPAARRHATFRNAIAHTRWEECVLLYGPHCPVSFLQHFSEAVHGKAFAE